MSDILTDLFPHAPLWVPWLALILMSLLILFFLACLVANPLEAWHNRQARGTDTLVTDLRRFQKIEADLLVAPKSAGHRAND
jgi:hypothetical protein